ncbi:PKD domain-containing protein [Archangium violaceum]|uniref:PKD domain-containing protein n=1 Tax=Archangium violaceum TaxID=83451 RepID=UPI0036D9E542
MKRCVAALLGLLLFVPVEAGGFAVAKEVTFGSVELLDATGAGSCDDDGVLDKGETARLRVTLRNSGTELLKLTSMTLSSTDSGVVLPKEPKVYFPPIEPGKSASAEMLVGLLAPDTPADISLRIDYRDDDQTEPGDKTHTVTYRVNMDERLESSTLETVDSARHPWTVTVPATGLVTWARTSDPAGAWFFRGPANGRTTDLSLVSPPLQVSETEEFRVIFQQRYAFEANPTGVYYDGAVIELSQDDGKSWVGLEDSVSPAYNATIYAGDENPLKGKKAYGGQSIGYPAFTKATLSLGTTYAGKTVRIRFRIGTDSSKGDTGWDVDELQLEGVKNTPFTTLEPHRGKCTDRAPVANAGADQTVEEGRLVTLSGSGTDPEGAKLTYAWTQSKGPSVTFNDASVSSPTFLAPDVTKDTELQFELRVSDGVNTSPPDVVIVKVRDIPLPMARAGDDQVVREGSGVTLDGSGSRDPEDAGLIYTWTQQGEPKVNLLQSGPRAMFNAPEVDGEMVLTFQLQVKDALGQTSEDSVTVRVTDREVAQIPGKGCAAGPEGGGPTTALLLLTALGITPRARQRRSL